jgi:hypothetical protein
MLEKLLFLLGKELIMEGIKALSDYLKRRQQVKVVIKRVKQISKESKNDQDAARTMGDLLNL